MDGVNEVSRRGRQLTALLGGAGLHDHGMTLGQACDVQRPTYGEEFALMTQNVHFPFFEEPPSLLIEREGTLLPAVPEALHHFDELGGPRVPSVVVDVLLAIEIAGHGLGPGGADVPTGATVADDVNRCEFAGNVERLVVSGRGRGDEANVLRHDGERGQ